MRFELRDREDHLLQTVEAETLADGDAYGLARLPGYFRAVELPEDDLGGLRESWRILHPEWSPEQVEAATTGHFPTPAQIAERAAVPVRVTPGPVAGGWRRRFPNWSEDLVRIATTGR